jgi:hypothetical protein
MFFAKMGGNQFPTGRLGSCPLLSSIWEIDKFMLADAKSHLATDGHIQKIFCR